MNFSFVTPGQIVVRRGGLKDVGAICANYGKKPAVFRFGNAFTASGMYDTLRASLERSGLDHVVYGPVQREPAPEVIGEAARVMRENSCDCAIAIGGGSVIDTAKAAAALAPNEGDIMRYVAGFDPIPFAQAPLPVIALPTTAGTGSECTNNSVITKPGEFKNSVRDAGMLPRVALLDAEIMTGVSAETTTMSGADAICQLIEAYVSANATPMTDALALHFTKSALEALPLAVENGADLDAREAMAIASSASGICLSNGGLGAAHGFAATFGAMTGLKHGFLCGVLLPHVMRFNIGRGVTKYADIARFLGHSIADDKQAALKAVAIVQKCFDAVGVPRDLRGHNIWGENVPQLAKISTESSSMQKNPVRLSAEDCEAIIRSLI